MRHLTTLALAGLFGGLLLAERRQRLPQEEVRLSGPGPGLAPAAAPGLRPAPVVARPPRRSATSRCRR